jgi:hypothetical protein
MSVPLSRVWGSAARASAMQGRLPEPEKLEETILPPLAACWGESQQLIQHFLPDSNHEIGPIIQVLEGSLAENQFQIALLP